jgi:hypothetical protein
MIIIPGKISFILTNEHLFWKNLLIMKKLHGQADQISGIHKYGEYP